MWHMPFTAWDRASLKLRLPETCLTQNRSEEESNQQEPSSQIILPVATLAPRAPSAFPKIGSDVSISRRSSRHQYIKLYRT